MDQDEIEKLLAKNTRQEPANSPIAICCEKKNEPPPDFGSGAVEPIFSPLDIIETMVEGTFMEDAFSILPTSKNLKKSMGGDKNKEEKNSTRRTVSISNQRRTHILNGDRTGGGHRPGLGKPGKSEFPKGMTDDQIIDTIMDIASDPTSVIKSGRGGRIIVDGMRDGIDIRVILESDGRIISGFPTNTPRNMRK